MKDLPDLSVSTTPATTTSASPPVSPPVLSTSVYPPQTPPAASLSVPPVLVIVLGVVLLLLLVPLLILIQQNRVMRRGRRDPETVILCLIQCVISHVLWTDSRFVCLHSQLSLRGDTGRCLRPFMRRFSTDTITSLRGVRHEPSISFNSINKSLSDSWCSSIISPVKPPASNHRIPDRKPQSCRCMFMCVCVCVCVSEYLFLWVFLDCHKEEWVHVRILVCLLIRTKRDFCL